MVHRPFDLPELAGVHDRFIEPPGLRMHVAEAREVDPVLLLHGFPQHWWAWRGVIPRLEHAADLTIEVVQGASHFIPDEQPDAVAEMALELFARA